MKKVTAGSKEVSKDEQEDEVVEQLETLNAEVRQQRSFGRIFITGVIYGIGFVVGSTIIATIAIGIFLPFFADIPFIKDNFQRGAELIHDNQN